MFCTGLHAFCTYLVSRTSRYVLYVLFNIFAYVESSMQGRLLYILYIRRSAKVITAERHSSSIRIYDCKLFIDSVSLFIFDLCCVFIGGLSFAVVFPVVMFFAKKLL